MRFIPWLTPGARLLIRASWLGVTLILVSLGRPVTAQTEDPTLGIHWALWVGQPVLDLSFLDRSAGSDKLLLAAGPSGALAIDPGPAAVVWDYVRPGSEPAFGPPPSRDGILYLNDTALDLSTGEPLWQLPVSDPGPMLLTDEALYRVGPITTLALNPQTGEIFWRTSTIDQGPILAQEGMLYIIGPKEMWAVEQTNGALRWRRPGEIVSDVEPRLLGDKLIVSPRRQEFQAVNIHTGQSGPLLPFQILIGHSQTSGIIYALAEMIKYNGPDQLLAFDPAGEQILWHYPPTDPNGIYLAPSLKSQPEPLFDGQAIYAVDQEDRVVALDAVDGAQRWMSAPLPVLSPWGAIYRLGELLIIPGDNKTPAQVLDRSTGAVRSQPDSMGSLAGVAANGVILEQTRLGSETQEKLGIPDRVFDQTSDSIDLSRFNLRQAGTGQLLLGNLILSQPPPAGVTTPPLPIAAGERGFIYFAHDQFVYAVGPAAPGEAVSAASRFLANGDYRSAVRTLGLLKTSDETGYLANGGEAVADQALNRWLAEADVMLAENPGAVPDFLSAPTLRYAVGILQIREAQAHLQYLHAYLQLQAFTLPCESYCPPVDELPEVRQLHQKFGDTVWAERLEPLLAPKRDQMTPHITLGSTWTLRWYYPPFILSFIAFLVVLGFGLRPANLYQAGLVALLSCCGGLSYLFWATSRQFVTQFYLLTIPLDLALVTSLPLTVWLLTRRRAYTWLVFGLSLVFIVIRWQLEPMPLSIP